jgi:hypothetical protein
MRFLVSIEPSSEGGRQLDAQPGGPGPLFGAIADRFHPEAFFTETTRRKAWWVISFDRAEDVVAFTHVSLRYCDAPPTLIPVMSGEEAARSIPAAIEAARQLLPG